MSSSISGSQVPWENKKPLQDIKKDREEENKQENDSLDDVFSQNLFNDPFNLPNDYLQIENQNNSFNSSKCLVVFWWHLHKKDIY